MSNSSRRTLRGLAVATTFLFTYFTATEPQAEAQPGFSGLWKPTKYITELRTADGSAPPLLAEAQAIYDKNKAAFRAGDTSFYGVYPCLYLGQPRMNFIPYPIEIIDRPHLVAMIYEWDGFRRIDMAGKPIEVEYPTLNGVGIGKRVNGELVITTQGLLGTTFLDAAGMPHSEELKITERLRLLKGGDLIENRVTFEDSQTFSKPWETVLTWKRIRGERKESVCVDRMVEGKPALDPKN